MTELKTVSLEIAFTFAFLARNMQMERHVITI